MEPTISTASLAISLDNLWVIIASMLVFIMQAGFAMCEAGFARTKNTGNILMKNLLDFSIGSILFWIIGFGIMFGPSLGNFFGLGGFLHHTNWSNEDSTILPDTFLIFQTMFCATSATIVSGAMAERTKFHSYLCYCIMISILIYPVSGHWTWGGGWLAQLGFHDFAGSTVVHSVGGWLALVGATLVGPREGKYRKGKVYAIPGHNLTIATLGIFILWFGWFGFNPGSQLAASGIDNISGIAHTFLTTNIAAAFGGVTALLCAWKRYGKPTLSLSLNGVLAGLVGVTAGCDLVSPFGAAVIGILCGMAMVIAVWFFDSIAKIDDPVGAISVHGVCGTLGTILTGFLSTNSGLLYGHGWRFLGIQTLGAVTTAAWALCAGYVVFKTIKHFVGLRVDKRVEEEGLDIYEHGETAYN